MTAAASDGAASVILDVHQDQPYLAHARGVHARSHHHSRARISRRGGGTADRRRWRDRPGTMTRNEDV